MLVALDESGSFALNIGSRPAVSVAVAVVIPNDERVSLLSAFRSFRGTLRPSELLDNEPKGGQLRPRSKERFCTLLGQHPRVQVCPCILDLAQFHGDTGGKLRDALATDVSAIADRSFDKGDLKRVSALISQLSPVQGVRLYTWARCLAWGLQQAILTPDVGSALDEWDHREFLIDPVQTTTKSDEESIFEEMLPMWMVEWSTLHPFEFLDERDHPHSSFRHRFVQGDRIDLDEVLTGRVRFDHSSRVSEFLQIADIAANIVYRAARNLQGADLEIYQRLVQCCPYDASLGVGLITPHVDRAGPGKPNRFSPLSAAMERATLARDRVFCG